MEVVTEKFCRKCGITYSIGQFQKHNATKDGLHPYCRQCNKQYHQEYYASHRKEAAAAGLARRLANPERKAMSDARWALANPDKVRANRLRWHERHPGLGVQRAREWAAANPESAKLSASLTQAKRRASKRGGDGHITARQWRAKLDYYNNCCAYCLGKFEKLTMDHMIPLSRGGQHTDENIVPACGSCNSRKSARTPMEFIAGISVPRVSLGVASP